MMIYPTKWVDALIHIRLALDLSNGTIATDRPDLPASPETTWTIDHARELTLVDDMLRACGVDPMRALPVGKVGV